MLKRIPLIARIGFAFILVGGSFFIGIHLWEASRIWVPVNIPISLSSGHTKTDDFKLNLDSSYVVYIAIDQGSDYEQTLCLVGIQQCDDKPSIFQASWTLYDAGKPIVTSGLGLNQRGWCGNWDVICLEIGSFIAHKGKRYSLNLDILKDASRLNSLNPRLIVQENGQHWLYGPIGDIFQDIATLFILFGLLLLGRWIFTKGQARRSPMWLSFTSPGQKEKLHIEEAPSNISAESYSTNTKITVWAGAFMILLGFTSFAATYHWFVTRTFIAVDMPVSLARGRINVGPFPINLRDSYTVDIDTGDERLNSFSCSSYDRVKANWILYSNGRAVDSGNNADTPYLYFGGFTSEKTTYNLELNVLSDSNCLDPGHPRLRIYTNKSSYADNIGILLGLFLLTSLTGFGLIVLWLLPVQCISHGRKLQLTETSPLGQYFPYAQALPLRRKFEGFRSFGLVGAITMVVVLFPVWVVTQWHEVSVGLPVSLLRRGATLKRIDPWTEPIILQVIDVGAGKPPKIELNSKLFSWDDLQPKLKQEIARRPPGAVVYIVGDENLPWADVVYAIDTARGLQAKVVLLGKEIE